MWLMHIVASWCQFVAWPTFSVSLANTRTCHYQSGRCHCHWTHLLSLTHWDDEESFKMMPVVHFQIHGSVWDININYSYSEDVTQWFTLTNIIHLWKLKAQDSLLFNLVPPVIKFKLVSHILNCVDKCWVKLCCRFWGLVRVRKRSVRVWGLA